MNMLNKLRGKFAALQLALLACLVAPGLALATTPTTADNVVTQIAASQADAIKIAVAVVLALWAIWGIYLMRRKG